MTLTYKTMNRIADILQSAGVPAIMSGAPGSLAATLWHDAPAGTLPDMVTLLAPKTAIEIQTRYARAGADILKTLSFAANSLTMPRTDTARLCAEAVSHCRTAARAGGKKILTAGCIGQISRKLTDRPSAELALAFGTQAKALIDAGADLLLYETVYDATQARVALDGIMRVATNTPVWISGVCGAMSPDEFAEIAVEYRVGAAGYNCTPPDRSLGIELRRLKTLLPGLPIFAAPSAAPRFAARAAEITHAAGLSCIGGCCGVTPRHISTLRRSLNIKSLNTHQINA